MWNAGINNIMKINTLLLVVLLSLINCNGRINEVQKLDEISWTSISKNPRLYHQDTVELIGHYVYEFEDSALYPNNNHNYSQALWVNFPLNRSDSYYAQFLELNGELVNVLGVLDTTDHGHLGSYLASIQVIEMSPKKK